MCVLTAAESAALDRATIGSGVPSRALMQRAGAAAASEIAIRFAEQLRRGVLVLAGPGNNGGDAWVVARALASTGVDVRVLEPVPAKTDDCRAEREMAIGLVDDVTASRGAYDGQGVVVDGLLGTGAIGAPRGEIGAALRILDTARKRDAAVVALDLPTGVDATTGEESSNVRADLTITFGALKRGHVIARDACGEIVVVDIGLIEARRVFADSPPPHLIDGAAARALVPTIPGAAHKGTRKKLAVIGGDRGMAGAVIIAARAALSSGAGMVRAVVHPASVAAVQRAVPAALVSEWPASSADFDRAIGKWADAVAIGPGLGRSEDSARVMRLVLGRWRGPLVLDADVFHHFAGNVAGLQQATARSDAVLTPHPLELATLLGSTVDSVVANRFDAATLAAGLAGATVLVKGVPTIVAARKGRSFVVASGTPTLATGGSGDALTGIIGALSGQMPVAEAALAGAWIHGRAAELASANPRGRSRVRGVTLDDVVAALSRAWSATEEPYRYPVIAELPRLR